MSLKSSQIPLATQGEIEDLFLDCVRDWREKARHMDAKNTACRSTRLVVIKVKASATAKDTVAPSGSSIILIAKASPGSRIASWSGGCSGASLTCMVTPKTGTVVTATFNTVPYSTYKGTIDYPNLNVSWKTDAKLGSYLFPYMSTKTNPE